MGVMLLGTSVAARRFSGRACYLAQAMAQCSILDHKAHMPQAHHITYTGQLLTNVGRAMTCIVSPASTVWGHC